MFTEIIKTNSTSIRVSPKNDRDFKLKELREMIGCDYIQIVETNDKRLMIVDEDGKLRNKEFNERATKLYKHGDSDIIVGDVVVINKDEIR